MTEELKKRRLVVVESLLPERLAVIRMLEPAGAANEPRTGRKRPSRRWEPFVVDRPGTRSLHFGIDATQSTMRIDAPDALVTPYKRKMMAFLLTNPNPCHIVMIGLGGGSLAKFCYRHLPATRITVVELDGDVIALRDEFRIPRDDDRFQVVCADGAAYLRREQTRMDVLLVDAFDDTGIARTVAAPAFFRNAAKALTRTGAFVMNLSGDSARIATAIKGARAGLDCPVALVSVASRGNLLLFAFKNRDPALLPESVETRAEMLQARLALGFPRFLAKLRYARQI